MLDTASLFAVLVSLICTISVVGNVYCLYRVYELGRRYNQLVDNLSELVALIMLPASLSRKERKSGPPSNYN